MWKKKKKKEKMNRQEKIAVIIVIIACLLGGFAIGTYVTIKAVANIAVGFIDMELIESAIFQYKNNIRNSYPSIFKNGTE